jgi:ABC-type transporter Mla subunit MlaD
LAHPEASENANAKPVAAVDGDMRQFVRQDAGHLPRKPESATEVVTDINSLIQRVAGASLSELQNVIRDLQHLHDFLHSEGERIQREISTYVQLSQTTMGSTKIIADNITQWSEAAESTAHALEKRRAEIANAKAPVAAVAR